MLQSYNFSACNIEKSGGPGDKAVVEWPWIIIDVQISLKSEILVGRS